MLFWAELEVSSLVAVVSFAGVEEEDEPQADVIREAAEAYEEATGISVEIQWKGRGIRSLIEPALDAGEQIDLFDDDYQRMAQEHRDYLAEIKKEWQILWIMRSILCRYCWSR